MPVNDESRVKSRARGGGSGQAMCATRAMMNWFTRGGRVGVLRAPSVLGGSSSAPCRCGRPATCVKGKEGDIIRKAAPPKGSESGRMQPRKRKDT
jgi:hypothetical protein